MSLKSITSTLSPISCMILFCSMQAAAQTQVKVVNTSKTPVPTLAQGTTTISGNVNVTNASLPVSGSVALTNSSLPVTGTVDVGNLPLDTNGNMRTSVAPDATQYQFQSIVATQCSTANGFDFCTGPENTPIEQTLSTLSSQGYELFSVTPISSGSLFYGAMAYTLRAPVAGAQRKPRR